MVIAIESLLFLLAGIVLAVVLTRVFGRSEPSPPSATAAVKLVRSPRTADGREETRLLINDKPILSASNDGVRLAAYADEVEQLEAVAARIAGALGVSVEFARVSTGKPNEENSIAMRDLPRVETDEAGEPERPRKMNQTQRTG